jgi:uncharacterized repeat protein (TIGR02543 family)
VKKYFSLIIIFLLLLCGCDSSNKYQVTLIDGEDVYTINIDKEDMLEDVQIKTGYKIDGFFTEASCEETSRWDELTNPVVSDITLYVKTSKINYNITIHHSSATLNPIILHYDDLISLPVLTKEGFLFDGFFLDSTFTTPFTLVKMPDYDLHLYVKWKEDTKYAVTYQIFDWDTNPEVDVILESDEEIDEFNVLRAQHFLTTKNRLFVFGYFGGGLMEDNFNEHRNVPFDITPYFIFEEGESIENYQMGSSYYVLTNYKRLFTWGSNDGGSLGDGTGEANYTPHDITPLFQLQVNEEIQMVSAGSTFTLVLTNMGRVFIFGYGRYGQNEPNTTNTILPTEITSNFNLSANEKIVDISCGASHAIVRTNNNSIFTFGYNNNGQLGNNTLTNSNLPINITSRFSFASGEMASKVIAIGFSTMLLTDKGRVFTWGDNREGELGNGTYNQSRVPIDITNQFNGMGEDKIVDLQLNGSKGVALTANNQIYVWGKNYYNTLLIEEEKSNVPVNITSVIHEMYPNQTVEIQIGGNVSMIRTENGKIYTWGPNSFGNMGDGTDITKTVPTKIAVAFPERSIEITYSIYEPVNLYRPTKEGYILSGYYLDAAMTTSYEAGPLSSNIVLYAKWEKVE